MRRSEAQAAIAAGAALAITALFWSGQIDLAAARLFFRPGGDDHWPLGHELPWSLLYRAAPWITASLVLGGLLFLALALVRRNRRVQRRAVFVVLSVVLGPGLLVNGVFKDHWDRPRPRDVVELDGTLRYSPAPLRGEGGKSFPCGHCSVGFLYGLGWWLWRARPLWAIGSLAAGLAVGAALGIGRLAAGGHFPSDIAWSAFISFAVAHWLYWYVLRIPAAEDAREAALAPPGRGLRSYGPALAAALGGMGVLSALFVTAHGTSLDAEIRLASLPEPPRAFEFAAARSDVDIVVVDSPASEVRVSGETHGFGLPGSRMVAAHQFLARPLPTLRYSLEQRGWFTDLDSRISLRVPAASLQRIVVRVGKGNVSLKDLTHEHAVRSGKVHADLRTEAGKVRISE
jgi:lipid A 4'-phosphatase